MLSRSEGGAPLATRSEVGWAAVVGRSNWGTPQIAGPTFTQRYLWAVASLLTATEARQLGALISWQDKRYKSKLDGALRLIDEFQVTGSEESPHSKTLLTTSTETWNASWVYGYPVCSVIIQPNENWLQGVGRSASGHSLYLATFSMIEL